MAAHKRKTVLFASGKAALHTGRLTPQQSHNDGAGPELGGMGLQKCYCVLWVQRKDQQVTGGNPCFRQFTVNRFEQFAFKTTGSRRSLPYTVCAVLDFMAFAMEPQSGPSRRYRFAFRSLAFFPDISPDLLSVVCVRQDSMDRLDDLVKLRWGETAPRRKARAADRYAPL